MHSMPIFGNGKTKRCAVSGSDSDEDELEYFTEGCESIYQLFTDQSYLKLLPLIKECLEYSESF